MPPKAKAAAPSKKTELKKKEKIVEDKTFGLKNKKGAKTQKFIQQVNKAYIPKKPDEKAKTSKKDEKEKELNELNQIFRPVATQKIEKGVDPKSVLCAFFKQGQCTKGDKCKFSHDVSVERKAEKRSIYSDNREDDKMADWDDEKLQDVINKKHSEAERNRTSIICKFFIDALETKKYGWFWTCPNGGDKCTYRHALPPGFVLKGDKKKEDKGEEISIEDLVEKERANLGSNLTKVTLQTFIDWKKRKIIEKREKLQKDEDRKKQDYKAGRNIGLSGRDMFTFNPDLADDDEMDEGESALGWIAREDDDEDIKYKELNFEDLQNQAKDIDEGEKISKRTDKVTNKEIDQATGNDEQAMPIDEDLFDDDDLDNIEDELNELTVQ